MARVVATDEPTMLRRYPEMLRADATDEPAMLPTAHVIATDEPTMLPGAHDIATDGTQAMLLTVCSVKAYRIVQAGDATNNTFFSIETFVTSKTKKLLQM